MRRAVLAAIHRNAHGHIVNVEGTKTASLLEKRASGLPIDHNLATNAAPRAAVPRRHVRAENKGATAQRVAMSQRKQWRQP
jgi:hypothetical protein